MRGVGEFDLLFLIEGGVVMIRERNQRNLPHSVSDKFPESIRSQQSNDQHDLSKERTPLMTARDVRPPQYQAVGMLDEVEPIDPEVLDEKSVSVEFRLVGANWATSDYSGSIIATSNDEMREDSFYRSKPHLSIFWKEKVEFAVIRFSKWVGWLYDFDQEKVNSYIRSHTHTYTR